MKKAGLIFVLLTALSLACYCQEEQQDENFHFIEAGLGAALNSSSANSSAFNVGLANSIGKTMANFIDYSMYFNKSGADQHEISIKIGPYLRINKYSYMAVSAGACMFINSSDSRSGYKNGMFVYEEPYQINIPVQAKVNTSLYKGLCVGVKATFNKMINKSNANKSSVGMYVAWGF